MTLKAVWQGLTALTFAASALALSQSQVERIPVPLTDPTQPALLEVGILSGSITVKGGGSKEVVVEARLSSQGGDEEEQPKGKKAGSLKRIPNTSSGLTVEEENNTVSIGMGLRGLSRRIDLTIQVPASCSMKLSTVNNGNIDVENVSGDLEVNNTNGSITLKQVAGSAVAQTVNGGVQVTFTRVSPDKEMSFISLNGDLDITFPASTKATLHMKSDRGEIYSDFDIQMTKSPVRAEKTEKGKGKYHLTLDSAVQGTINGGGQEVRFNSFNGTIYLRKGG